MKSTFSVLRGGALRKQSQVAEPTIYPEMELVKMWEIETEEYAVATGIPLEDVRNQVMPFEGWLAEQGFTVQGQPQELSQADVDEQMKGIILLAVHSVEQIGAAWDTYLRLKKQGVPHDELSTQVMTVRRDIDEAVRAIEAVSSRLFMYV